MNCNFMFSVLTIRMLLISFVSIMNVQKQVKLQKESRKDINSVKIFNDPGHLRFMNEERKESHDNYRHRSRKSRSSEVKLLTF